MQVLKNISSIIFALSLSFPVYAGSVIDEYDRMLKPAGQQPLGYDGLFGEQVSLLDGTTRFDVFDIEAKTRWGMTISLGRSLVVSDQVSDQYGGVVDWNKSPFGRYWDMEIPYIKGTFDAVRGWVGGDSVSGAGTANRCTQAGYGPPGTNGIGLFSQIYYQPQDFFSGIEVGIPRLGNEQIMFFPDMSSKQVGGKAYNRLTRSRWLIGCLPALKNGNGEGFIALLPDGGSYKFDWMVKRATSGIVDSTCAQSVYRSLSSLQQNHNYCTQGVSVPRVEVYIYATQFTDRFGNTVEFVFDDQNPERLTKIRAEDQDLITLQYSSQGRISAVTSGQRVWNYFYDADQRLIRVELPDGSQWKYSYGGGAYGLNYHDSLSTWRDCKLNIGSRTTASLPGSGETDWISVSSPSGVTGLFEFRKLVHGTKQTEQTCYFALGANGQVLQPVVGSPSAYQAASLYKKTISGPGFGNFSWNYTYEPSWVYPYKSITRINNPDGTLRYFVYGNDSTKDYGSVLEDGLVSNGEHAFRNTYHYLDSAGQLFPKYIGKSLAIRGWSISLFQYNIPLYKKTTTFGGDYFSYEVQAGCGGGSAHCFDEFARPTKVKRSGASGSVRTDLAEYRDDLSSWVLGLPKRTTNIETGLIESEVEYNAQALPVWTKKFGKLQQTMTYNTDGTLATVADGRGNVTAFSSWKRGIPQLVAHPGGATESATVDDNGWITSITDENGFVTGYGYDAMGRLASTVHPTGDTLAGGATAYHTTWSEFRALTDTDWKPAGISTGQWRQVKGTGDHVTVTYLNALWQPVLVHDYDQANVASTLRSTRTEYDTSNRVSFQSYPTSDLIPGAIGTRTFYDALDRVVRVEQDSELGAQPLATTTEYLPGLRTRVTNPRNQQITTSFMAWDQPGYDLPILSEQPESKVIQIDRHPQFGWPLALTQRNAANTLSATRRYVYDVYAQLCKTIEPEIGATVTEYDAAGNVDWTAAGLNGGDYADTATCSRTPASTSGRKVSRTYDARNRLSQLLFPDGRGDQAWTYTPDGLPASITTYNGTGNTVPVVMAYTYNKRRLLTGESITQYNGASPWYTWTIGYAYNAYGHLASQTYPTGLTVDYAPNPLGQATKAGIYASGAQYYPNGALKQFTYGNGIVHTMQQNVRQLPSRVTSSGGVNDFTYNYDANGNVTNIWDLARGDNYSRWLSYDNLDRLTAAGSASFGGDHWHRMTYDALDNLESWKLAGVKDYADYVYDSQNRLMSIRNTAGATVVGLDYDPQGNLLNKNGQTYDFDNGNRLRRVNGKESYRYDGLGRRVQTTSDNGKTALWQYSQGGQTLFSSDWGGPNNQAQQTHENVYLAGSIIATIDHAWPSNAVLATRYQHTDALGSPVAVTNAAGQVTERMDYEPWGAIIGNPTRSGIGYTGHVMDGSTGLIYMQQRYYDHSVGRFLSVDPVTTSTHDGTSFNRYIYANGNGYKFKDPDGRQVVTGQQFGYIPMPSFGDPESQAQITVDVHMRSLWFPFEIALCGCNTSYYAPSGSGEVTSISFPGETIFPVGMLRYRGSMPSGLGDLTIDEVRQIQRVVDEAGRPLEVVGSAARGSRRGVGSSLPVGKGAGTRSDIDYVTGPSSIKHFENLQNKLPGIDPKTGIVPGTWNFSMGPVIRFEPKK